eukprot:GHVU01177816.1.p2 GENE.GHVU01177816.1~~GHVU01177816.1.p2  ORF type:complete len:147 (-),score=15.00 GHVU01177816.1:2313-2753(-)
MLDRTEFTALLQDIAAKEGIQQRLSDRFCLSVYREMDSSSSGAISWDEFKEFFRDFYTHRKHRLEQAIAGASQFTPAWPSPSASMPPATEDPLQEDELKQLWAHFDRDNSGTLVGAAVRRVHYYPVDFNGLKLLHYHYFIMFLLLF